MVLWEWLKLDRLDPGSAAILADLRLNFVPVFAKLSLHVSIIVYRKDVESVFISLASV